MIHISSKDLFDKAKPIIKKGGYFDVLEREMSAIERNFDLIRHDLKITDDVRDRLFGHYGLRGEFGNGIGMAIKTFLKEFERPLVAKECLYKENVSKAIRLSFNHFAATFYDAESQKSQYDQDVFTNEEKSGPAIERSLLSLRDWMESARENAGSLEENRRDFVTNCLNEIQLSAEKCEECFAWLEDLAQLTSLYAIQNWQKVELIATREQFQVVRKAKNALKAS